MASVATQHAYAIIFGFINFCDAAIRYLTLKSGYPYVGTERPAGAVSTQPRASAATPWVTISGNERPVRATDDKPNAMKLASIAEVRRRKAIAKSLNRK